MLRSQVYRSAHCIRRRRRAQTRSAAVELWSSACTWPIFDHRREWFPSILRTHPPVTQPALAPIDRDGYRDCRRSRRGHAARRLSLSEPAVAVLVAPTALLIDQVPGCVTRAVRALRWVVTSVTAPGDLAWRSATGGVRGLGSARPTASGLATAQARTTAPM